MATQKVKLTPAQIALLAERKGTFIDTYKPGMKLIELALVDASKSKFGVYSWAINSAGETFLASRKG
ncbi:hypothetical protein IPC1135_29770 [Pseudomonas aeruginosa]|uniref:hypothetical protein n=1 Tax=Pseudomonas aeruginosa TaxID=287 RepID=UPI000FC41049|nr:hypothetical protein [Pseudomonas aeruginosa]RUE86359.1 hypothetical protein IPC1135_29770 [Pseudomonas aeruginosa]